MDNKEYYYGTSSKVNIGEWLTPTPKAIAIGKRTVQVTDSLDAAIFYAKRTSDKDSGEPVVYIVEPVLRDLLQKNSTDYITSRAKIIGIKQIPKEPP